jgi:hypothetical protein
VKTTGDPSKPPNTFNKVTALCLTRAEDDTKPMVTVRSSYRRSGMSQLPSALHFCDFLQSSLLDLCKPGTSLHCCLPHSAKTIRAWQQQTPYGQPTDRMFASTRLKGKQPRVANMLVEGYLRPAAVKVGVLRAGEKVRFGFHNLRHSLASFLVRNDLTRRAESKRFRAPVLYGL